MGECLIMRRGGETWKVPVLDASWPRDVATTVIKGNTTSATFTAVISEAGNPASYTYQWYVNGSAVSGATGSSYTMSGLSETAAYSVYCEITNKAGTVQTRAASLKVTQYYTPVLNTSYPANVTGATVGGNATFKVTIATAGNPASYTYQWYVNGSAVSGATGATYTRSNLTLGTYTVYCKVTNAAGTVQSRTATLTVTKQYIFKTGTGLGSGVSGFTCSRGSATVNTTQITATLPSYGGKKTTFLTTQTVDVTNYKTVTFEGVTASWSGAGAYNHQMYLTAGDASVKVGAGNSDQYPDKVMSSDGTFRIDVSALSGKIQIGGYYSCSDDDDSTGTFIIKNIYLTA